jgi:hypothetical protein
MTLYLFNFYSFHFDFIRMQFYIAFVLELLQRRKLKYKVVFKKLQMQFFLLNTFINLDYMFLAFNDNEMIFSTMEKK